MSLNTAIQQLATGLAPMIAGAIILETPDKRLTGFPIVGIISAATAAVSLFLAGRIKPVSQEFSNPRPQEKEADALAEGRASIAMD